MRDMARVVVRGVVARLPFRNRDDVWVVVVKVTMSFRRPGGAREDGVVHVHVRLTELASECAPRLPVGTRVVVEGFLWPWPCTDEPEMVASEIAVALPRGSDLRQWVRDLDAADGRS